MTMFYQPGLGKGKRILFVGESPSPKGWNEGKACRNSKGDTLPTGKRINDLLKPFCITVDECGFAELCQSVLKERRLMRKRAKNDWPEFLKIVVREKRKLIIVLGVETTNVFSSLCGYEVPMGEISKIKLGTRVYSVLPIYHPSPINPKSEKKNNVITSRLRKRIENLVK